MLRPSSVINTVPPDSGKLVALIAGSNGRSVLMAGDDDKNVYDKKPQRHDLDNRTIFNCTQW